MKLVKELVGSLTIGLLGLVLVAAAVDARSNFDEAGGLSIGVRGGGLLPVSDLDGVMSLQGSAFLRYGLKERLQLELGAGYGQYTTEDDIWTIQPHPRTGVPTLLRDRGNLTEYYTHLPTGQLRILYAPMTKECWAPYVFAGVGVTKYNVEDITPRRGDDGIGWATVIPLGAGVRYELSDKLGLEASGGYTLAMSDKIDESDDGGSKDNYISLLVGLTYDLTLGEYTPPTARPTRPERPAIEQPEAPADQDGDGLTDEQERTRYFTNPLMVDSDGDGLNDGSEVKVYRTNPNKADSDGGSVNDGAEVDRGTDPLDAADDVVRVEERAMPPSVDYEFPTVNFPSGGDMLTTVSKSELKSAARVLMENKGVLLVVGGYTDSAGYTADNIRLSWRRAYAVKDYLVSQGVPGWRLSVKAYGAADPVASNATADGRAKNRRVELKVFE